MSELEEHVPIQAAYLSLDAFERCGWNDICDREFTVVVSGFSADATEISADLWVNTSDSDHSVLERAKLDVIIDVDGLPDDVLLLDDRG